MLSDRAKAMMLLNEAARLGRKNEALAILSGQSRGESLMDWRAAREALENLLHPAPYGARGALDPHGNDATP